jgi:phospholipase A1
LNPNRGALQFAWSFPIGGPFKGYVQYFYGYGDGLIDYNHVSNRISLGFILYDWM